MAQTRKPAIPGMPAFEGDGRLPMDHQVESSGQTVALKLYLARR